MKCLNCGKEISTGQNFCKYCGASVKIQPATNKQAFKTCKKCGAPINEGNRFCDQCGTPINDVIVIDDGEETGKLKKITKAIIIILCVAALCGLGILAYNLLKNGSMFGAGGNNQNQKEDNVASDILPQPAADVTEPDSQETKPAAENKDTEGAEKDQSSGDNSIDPVAVKNTVTIDVNIPYEAVTFENHSYYIFDNGCESWNEAKKYCESRGGYLAVINSPEENEFLYNYMLDIGYDEVFFGYTDQDQEGKWKWVAGKSSDYTDWGINDEGSVEPNSTNEYEDYAHMNSAMHDGHWNDKKYGQKTTCYFCEWDVESFLETDRKGKPTKDGVALKNNSYVEADTILELDHDEELKILYSLAKDNGEVWYYVQHKTGAVGYVMPELLVVN